MRKPGRNLRHSRSRFDFLLMTRRCPVVIERAIECGDAHHGFARIYCDAWGTTGCIIGKTAPRMRTMVPGVAMTGWP